MLFLFRNAGAVRWNYVVSNFVQVLASLFYMYYIFERFCIPVFRNFDSDFVTPRRLIVSTFGCMLPATLVLFISESSLYFCLKFIATSLFDWVDWVPWYSVWHWLSIQSYLAKSHSLIVFAHLFSFSTKNVSVSLCSQFIGHFVSDLHCSILCNFTFLAKCICWNVAFRWPSIL